MNDKNFLPDDNLVKSLLDDQHNMDIRNIMYYYVLHFIHQRKVKNHIENNSNDDVFPTDIYDHYTNYILPDSNRQKRKEQRNTEKHAKKNDKKDKSDKKSTKKKMLKLKLPINIQSQWVSSVIYLELSMLKEAFDWGHDKKSKLDQLTKISENNNNIYKLISETVNLYQNAFQIEEIEDEGKNDDCSFITRKINILKEQYQYILPKKKNAELSNKLSRMMIDFIKVLAWYAETDVWHTSQSKSCNQHHFTLRIDMFSKITYITIDHSMNTLIKKYANEKNAKKPQNELQRSLKEIEILQAQVNAFVKEKEKDTKKKNQSDDLDVNSSDNEDNNEDDYPSD